MPCARIVELEHVPCDLCGADDYRVRYRKPDDYTRMIPHEFCVVACNYCGLVYVNPRPTEESMANFYPKNYHLGRDTAEHLQRYRAETTFLGPLSSQRVLDIGCARGDFLSFLLDLFPDISAFGVDRFSESVSDKRIAFFQGDITEAGLESCSFDIVTAWAVFEHLHRPRDYFRAVWRILKPGGRFIILVTNSNSAYGRFAYREDIPRHTYHFSPSILHRYAAAHDFIVDRIVHDDSIFDGRGDGMFRALALDLLKVDWSDRLSGNLGMHGRIVHRLARRLDGIVFHRHWEKNLGISGIIVAQFRKAFAPTRE